MARRWVDGRTGSYAYVQVSAASCAIQVRTALPGCSQLPPTPHGPTGLRAASPWYPAVWPTATNAVAAFLGVHNLVDDAIKRPSGHLFGLTTPRMSRMTVEFEQISARDSIGNLPNLSPPQWPTARCTWPLFQPLERVRSAAQRN